MSAHTHVCEYSVLQNILHMQDADERTQLPRNFTANSVNLIRIEHGETERARQTTDRLVSLDIELNQTFNFDGAKTHKTTQMN